MTKDTDGTYYYDLSVNGTGKYNYIFSNNGNTQTPDIDNIPYAPGKEVVFDVVGKVVSNTAGGSSGSGDAVGQGSNSDGSYTLTIPGDAFTNTMTTQLNLQITKTDSVETGKTLEGAKFTLKEQGKDTSVEATTDEKGIATFANIQRGATYYLRETKAPVKLHGRQGRGFWKWGQTAMPQSSRLRRKRTGSWKKPATPERF